MFETNQELRVSVYPCVFLHLFSSLSLSSPLSYISVCPSYFPLPHFPVCDAAVQEERQRNKEREGEVESTSAANEEMPVEKILEAEMAVEQKTELHADGSSGGSSVSKTKHTNSPIIWCQNDLIS